MYFWKCWRDTRNTFLTLMGLLIVTAALTATVNACTWEPGVGWTRPNAGQLTTTFVGMIWDGTMANIAMMSSLALPMIGALLGGYGVGVDFQNGTAIFLTTRPRPRWYYLVVSWAVGLMEIAIAAALTMVTVLLLLLYFTRRIPNWKFLAMWPLMIVAASILFSIAGYIGMTQRRGRDAGGAVIILWVAYIIVGVVLQARLRVAMPQIWDMFNPFISGHGAIPWSSAALWMITLPVCAGLSWLSFEGAEI